MHGILGDPFDSKARMATQRKTGIERVVKEISKAQIADIGNFDRKVRLLNSLNHPNILNYTELFEDEYSYYLSSDC